MFYTVFLLFLHQGCTVVFVYASLLSRVVVGGDKRHLADDSGHCFFPDLHLDGCSILSEGHIHVTHGNILFQAGRGAAAGHLTYIKHIRVDLTPFLATSSKVTN